MSIAMQTSSSGRCLRNDGRSIVSTELLRQGSWTRNRTHPARQPSTPPTNIAPPISVRAPPDRAAFTVTGEEQCHPVLSTALRAINYSATPYSSSARHNRLLLDRGLANEEHFASLLKTTSREERITTALGDHKHFLCHTREPKDTARCRRCIVETNTVTFTCHKLNRGIDLFR